MKPRVTGLLLLVAVASYVIAAVGEVVIERILLLAVAGALSAGGAAMLNHYLDADVDGFMQRTKQRPLPAGLIKNPRRVFWLGCGLTGLGTIVGFKLGFLSGLMIATGALVYVVLYTLVLKPRTHWSTVVGGISGSCAAMAGWFAAAPPSHEAFIAGLLLFTWQVAHFWPLTIARLADYEQAGIPTLPGAVGARSARIFIALATVATIGAALALGGTAGMGPLFFAGALAFALFWLSATAVLLAQASDSAAWRAFKCSGLFLGAIYMLMVLDVVLRR